MTSSITRRLFVALTAGALLSVSANAQETRTISTTFGEVEIPANPQRIVTTHYIATQPLLDLGVIPVGSGNIDQANTTYWETLKDIPFVTAGAELNIEQVAALKPDLIFEINIADEKRIEQLRQIAPVIIIGIRGDDRANWQGRVHRIADAVNKLDEYAVLEASLAARQEAIKAEYADTLAANRFAVLAVWTPGEPVVFTSNSMSGKILSGAGALYADASEALKLDNGADVNLSDETIGDALADATAILYNVNLDGSDNAATSEFRTTPVFTSIPAVAAGKAFPLGKATIAGFGDANAILDFFEQTLDTLSGN